MERVAGATADVRTTPRQGLLVPLRRGDAEIASVLDALARHEFDGRLVLEHHTAITGDEPPVAELAKEVAAEVQTTTK